jgi:hypothetical protein
VLDAAPWKMNVLAASNHYPGVFYVGIQHQVRVYELGHVDSEQPFVYKQTLVKEQVAYMP